MDETSPPQAQYTFKIRAKIALDKLADMTDKIRAARVPLVASTFSRFRSSDINQLTKRLDVLTKMLEQFMLSSRWIRTQCYPHVLISKRTNSWCWFHKIFGENLLKVVLIILHLLLRKTF